MNRIYERIYCFFSAAIFDRIYTVCSSDVHLLKKIWFMPKHKVQLQLNGVTRKLISAQAKRELRLKYLKEWSEQTQQQLTESAIYLGIVARLSPEKNHLRIFSLFEQLLVKIAQQTDGLNSNTKIYLLVFGLGPLELKLKREVVKKGIENSILFLGYHQNMAEKIAAFDLLISLSKGEGLPINLIEAGWAGTAVVANAIDGNRDLLTLPEQGVLLESSLSDAEILKKLIAVIVYNENIERMGRSFQQHVQENFSEDKWLCNLKNSYQELGLKWF
jgi:glycosyltransferase involved in cell wall biosynthesis